MHKENLKVLVTGSAGFLGASMSYELLKNNFKVIGVDNYINSDEKNTSIIKRLFDDRFNFVEADISNNNEALESIFSEFKPNLVMHFAALKSVPESIKKPKLYLENNIKGTENILNFMRKFECKNIIYSSSAAVYSEKNIQPLDEDSLLEAKTPYAESKIECEKRIINATSSDKIKAVILRYFNPVCSHKDNIIHDNINNGSIMNEIIKTALGINKKLLINGNDYDTKDGTCERDFIHVQDLLNAHIECLNLLKEIKNFIIMNVGTGRSISILELIDAFQYFNSINIDHSFSKRRDGDIVRSFTNSNKIYDQINWNALYGLSEIVKDSWLPFSK